LLTVEIKMVVGRIPFIFVSRSTMTKVENFQD